jgi:hypothetical protein
MTTATITALHEEVRALARERNAVILAHNYQVPEVQDVGGGGGGGGGGGAPARGARGAGRRRLRRRLARALT